MLKKKQSERVAGVLLCRGNLGDPEREPDPGTDRDGATVCPWSTDADLVARSQGTGMLSGVLFVEGRAVGILGGDGNVQPMIATR